MTVHAYIRTDKAGHLGEDLSEPRTAGDHISGDAMDLDIARIEVVKALRRTHQPGGFFHHLPVTDFGQANRAWRAPEPVCCLKVYGRELDSHALKGTGPPGQFLP
jgi:hypothetical protein